MKLEKIQISRIKINFFYRRLYYKNLISSFYKYYRSNFLIRFDAFEMYYTYLHT